MLKALERKGHDDWKKLIRRGRPEHVYEGGFFLTHTTAGGPFHERAQTRRNGKAKIYG